MGPSETDVRQSIDYLLGTDTTERWPVTDPPVPTSPEDYGVVSAMTLAKMAHPTTESMAALIHGALKFDDDYVKAACSEAIAEIDSELAKSIFLAQTMDSEPDVRDNAFERLWQVDGPDFTLARAVRDRLLHDSDESVRATAEAYRESEEKSSESMTA